MTATEKYSCTQGRALGYASFFWRETEEKREAGRKIRRTGYRYGFNGMERDDEVKGIGNSYDFGSRILDPRLGRWMSIDPQAEKYPYSSPYAAFGDNPIYYIDPGGETLKISWADPDHVESYKASVSIAFDGKVEAQVSEEGIVTFHQLPNTELNQHEQAGFSILKKVENSTLTTEQRLVGGDELGGTLGAFSKDVPSLLNVDVLKALGNDPNTLNTRAGLIHETVENFNKAEIKDLGIPLDEYDTFTNSHRVALDAEHQVTYLQRSTPDGGSETESGSKHTDVVENKSTLNGEKGTYRMESTYDRSSKKATVTHEFTPDKEK